MANEQQLADGYYWAKVEGEWEVVELNNGLDGRADISRAGSDVIVFQKADGTWEEFGSPLEVSQLVGPLEPPNT